MSLIRGSEFRRAAAVALLVGAFTARLVAQNAIVTLISPANSVIVNSQVQLNASITDLAGTPIDASGLAWAVSDTGLASVSPHGVLSGIMPGDITVTVADSNTGASAAMPIHVTPFYITLTATPEHVHAGDTAKLAAVAYDANSAVIPGVQFQFASGEPSVATVSADGTITGVAEGFATLAASIPSASNDPALVETAAIQVTPPAAYATKKLLTSGIVGTTQIAAHSQVAATTANEIGSIVTLANGGQAAVLMEGGQIKVLAVAGQVLPNTGRMVVRLDAISANSKGDVALLVEYPAQWCSASVILFPHNKPEVELGTANCGNGLHLRSLAEDGSVLFRYNFNGNDQVLKATADGVVQTLFATAAQSATSDPVRSLNDFTPSGAGTFILNAYLTSGAHVYLYGNGKTLTQVYRDGDQIRNFRSNSMDNPIGGVDGSFYARINGNNFEALQQLAPGPPKTLIFTGDSLSSGTLGWIHYVIDANAAGVLVMGDYNTNPYHSSVFVWNGSALNEYAPAAGYSATISGAMLSDGSVLVSTYLSNDNNSAAPALRTIASPLATPVTAFGVGGTFPKQVPVGIDWRVAPRGASGGTMITRGAGDAVVKVSASPQTILALGSALPNGKPCVWIGSVIANQQGDAVFTAGYPSGSVLIRYRAGKLELLGDTANQSTGSLGSYATYFFNYRGRFLAINSRDDVVSVAGYSNGAQQVVLQDASGSHMIARQSQSAPGGSVFSNFGNLAIDDNGRVAFIAQTNDGHTGLYYWDGSTLQRLVAVGDPGPNGYSLNELSNISGGGGGFVELLAFGNYATREVRYFDGKTTTTVESTDTSIFDGTGISWYWMNECTLAANGDTHCQAQTQDGGNGVYAHRGGNDVIVARTRDQFSGGEWMVQPFVVSSSASGEVYFTADVFLNGTEMLALYQATPK